MLIAALTTSFLSGIQRNPVVPGTVKSTATTEVAGGIPFLSGKDLKTALSQAGVPSETADAVVAENASARLDGLRASLAVPAIIAMAAPLVSRRIPMQQPAAAPAAGA